MVLKVFIYGMLIAPVAVFAQVIVSWLIWPDLNLERFIKSFFSQSDPVKIIVGLTVLAPLIEEYLKYAVVRFKVIHKKELDQPLDIMLYLIIAALGFAAVENFLAIFEVDIYSLKNALQILSARFLTSTFLHALSSGLLGYFLTLGFLNILKRKFFTLAGLGIAILFHSGYNYLISSLGQEFALSISFKYLIITAVLLISMGFIVSWQFKILKKQVGICK